MRALDAENCARFNLCDAGTLDAVNLPADRL